MKLNLFLEKSKKSGTERGPSCHENGGLPSRKSGTFSRMQRVEVKRESTKGKSARRRVKRSAKLKVDIAKLEKNLKKKKFTLNSESLSRLKQQQKFKTTSTKGQSQRRQKGSKKIRLSTYLKTERNVQRGSTPRKATQVDLRQISLKRKKALNVQKERRLEFLDKVTKESFASLKLLKKSKKLSQEETLLILKSLESEKALRKVKKGADIFFLKESKLKKRVKQGVEKSKRQSRKKMKLDLGMKFGTRNHNLHLNKQKHCVEFNSEKKKY